MLYLQFMHLELLHHQKKVVNNISCSVNGLFSAFTCVCPSNCRVYSCKLLFWRFYWVAGHCFFLLYFAGIFVALLVTSILSRTIYKHKNDTPFILELPAYRIPHWRPLLKRSLNSCRQFITKAGFVIFNVTVIVWVLGYFPHGSGQLESSWLANLGHIIEPVMQPLGLDWKYGVAILSSFLAREVFVGTLGTLFGIEGAEENVAGLAEKIQSSGLSVGAGVSLLIFYAIALQCVSTLALIRKELRSTKLAIVLFLSYGLLAYVLAWLAYQVI